MPCPLLCGGACASTGQLHSRRFLPARVQPERLIRPRSVLSVTDAERRDRRLTEFDPVVFFFPQIFVYSDRAVCVCPTKCAMTRTYIAICASQTEILSSSLPLKSLKKDQ